MAPSEDHRRLDGLPLRWRMDVAKPARYRVQDLTTRLPARAVVPPLEHCRLPLVSQHADRAGIQREQPSVFGRQSNPPRAEDAQQMTVREQSHVTVDVARTGNHAVRARPDVCGPLTIGRAVRPNCPVLAFLADVGRRTTL